MNITELLITGYDGPHHQFALTLRANEAQVVKLGIDDEGEAVVDEAWRRATTAFTAVRDIMSDIVSASGD